jgi:membrane protein implicated in regulation of membrane protease activity
MESAMEKVLLWFSLMFVFLFLEMGHPGLLYFLAFSGGSFFALLSAVYGYHEQVQLIIFIISTCLVLISIYFLLKSKNHDLASPSHRSNIEALIGKKVIVYTSVHDHAVLQAKILGQIWLVRSVHHEILHDGQEVIIVDVQGCHLRVDSIKK